LRDTIRGRSVRKRGRKEAGIPSGGGHAAAIHPRIGVSPAPHPALPSSLIVYLRPPLSKFPIPRSRTRIGPHNHKGRTAAMKNFPRPAASPRAQARPLDPNPHPTHGPHESARYAQSRVLISIGGTVCCSCRIQFELVAMLWLVDVTHSRLDL
jgi:hypothetical protein